MAIAFIQQQGGSQFTMGGAASVAATFSSNTTSGNLIVVAFAPNSSVIVSSIADGLGNTYVQATAPSGVSGQNVEIWYAKNITGGTTPTVTVTPNFATNATLVCAIAEYSGLDTISPLDQHLGATGTSTAPASGAVTTTSANELIFGAAMNAATVANTVGAGFGHFLNTLSATHPVELGIEDAITASTGSQNAIFGLGSSVAWGAAIATFKAAPGPNSPGNIGHHLTVGNGMSRSEVAN